MGETADLLRQLSTMDSCEAWTVTDAEHVAEEVPDWAEIVLSIERNGKELQHFFRRHDGELVMEVLREVLHPNAGRSILQALWEDLDALMDEIMSNPPDPDTKGQARGLALAIARMQKPYNPSLDAVRKEARERWKARQG
jgi:hypothetical protein